MNFQTVLYLSFSPVLLGVVVNWLFVIIKSYVKVSFKEKIIIIIIIIIIITTVKSLINC